MATASHRMELRAVCAPQIRKDVSSIPDSGLISWTVDATKPFGDEVNLGRFGRQLGVNTALELCHYHEGSVGDTIDLRRTPEELAYRPRMSVLVRYKKTRTNDQSTTLQNGILQMTEQQHQLLKKLQTTVVPSLGPDDPCPLCSRTVVAADLGGAEQSIIHHTSQNRSAHQQEQDRDIVIGARTHAETGVQVGNAGRINDFLPVSFGTASRMRDVRMDSLGGGVGSGAGFGVGRFEADDGISELKRQLDDTIRRAEELERRLRECEHERNALNNWKLSHRCEVSQEVAKVREQNTQLQEALRDIMRGREEVMGALVDRRTAGSMITDTPRPYAPLRAGAPVADSSPRLYPSQILAQTQSDIALSTARTRALLDNTFFDPDQPAEEPPMLLKRPSGVPGSVLSGNSAMGLNGALNSSSTNIKGPSTTQHAPGQCLLRVASITGDPFFVKRRMTSTIREGGVHIFTLLSLDGVVTDEIHVTDVVTCATEGPSGLIVSTRRNSWCLFMSPSERTQWLHWFYALNPFLSAERTEAGGIPNTY